MLAIYKKAIRVISYFVAALIILAALLVGITRSLTPYFNKHLPDFNAYASAMFQAPVAIDNVYLSWVGYQPELVFHHVQIMDKKTNKPTISIRKINLDLAIFRSLWSWRPMLDSIKISGVYFTVNENAKGDFNIGGYGISVSDNLTGASVGANEMLAWIFSQPKLELHQIDIGFIAKDGFKQPIELDHLILKNTKTLHQLHGVAVLQREEPVTVISNLDWTGDVADLPHVTAKLYLYVEGVKLSELSKQLSWHDFQIKEGLSSVKIWIDWKENALQSIQGKLQIYDLALSLPGSTQVKLVPRISGNINWNRSGQDQLITGEDILIDLPQHLWPTLNFSMILSSTTANVLTLKSFQINYLDLADTLNWIINSNLISQNIKNDLETLQPQGSLENLIISLPAATDISINNIKASFDLKKVSVAPWKIYPGIINLTGAFNWDGKQGSLDLNTQHMTLTYEKLFQNPLVFDQVMGVIKLTQPVNNQYDLKISSLQLKNQDLNLKTDADISIFSAAAPKVDVSTDFSVANVGHIIHYLPMNVFATNLKDWLKQAFVSGQIEEGKFILQGNMQDYPFKNNKGKLSITSKVKNFEFNFAPGWPTIHKLNGALNFSGTTMIADTDSGFIYQVPLKKVHAELTSVGIPDPSIVTVHGDISSDFAKGLYFIHHSPLETTIGSDLSMMNLKGAMDLSLDLSIPLAKLDATKVKGEIITNDATVSFPNWNFALNKAQGALQFTENGLEAKELHGQIFDETVSLALTTVTNPDLTKFIKINFQSQIKIPQLEKWLDVSLSKVLTGSTTYKAELDLAHHNNPQPTSVTLQSDLNGIAINAPSPYGKLADTKIPFKFELFIQPKDPMKAKISYGDLAQAAIILQAVNQKIKFTEALIHLGGGNADWPTAPGISITGQMDTFDWETWKNYADSLIGHPLMRKTQLSINDWWHSVDVHFNKLIMMGQELDQVRVTLAQLPDALQIGLTTNDMQGKITLPHDPKKLIQANFDRLYFSSTLEGKVSQLNPKTIPPISFIGNDVRMGDKKLGRLSFDTSPSASGLTINHLGIDSPLMNLTAKGNWKSTLNGYETLLDGHAESSQVSNLLSAWGFSQPNLIAHQGNLDFALIWSDTPYNPQPAAMSGTLSLKLGKGQIVNLSGSESAKLGIGRMLNILSLETLPRRLSLDFSDLTQKGYTFDAISGDFTLNEGNAYTKNTSVNGTIARIDISGRIGLKAKDYDLAISITPSITTSLPVVATIATGFNPIAGAAAWLVDKMVSKQVTNASTYHYTVTGPWDKPVWGKK